MSFPASKKVGFYCEEEKSANLKKSAEYLGRHKEVSEEAGRAGRHMWKKGYQKRVRSKFNFRCSALTPRGVRESSWNLGRFPSKFLHIFKVSSAFHCILHLNIRFIPSAMHKRRGKLSKKLFWAPKYTLSQITQEPLLVILWGFLWRLRAVILMYSTQKIGTFAVVEARNAPCPMEWGCPKDRSMTVVHSLNTINFTEKKSSRTILSDKRFMCFR